MVEKDVGSGRFKPPARAGRANKQHSTPDVLPVSFGGSLMQIESLSGCKSCSILGVVRAIVTHLLYFVCG